MDIPDGPTIAIAERIKCNNPQFYYVLLDYRDKHHELITRICGEIKGLNMMSRNEIAELIAEMANEALNK